MVGLMVGRALREDWPDRRRASACEDIGPDEEERKRGDDAEPDISTESAVASERDQYDGSKHQQGTDAEANEPDPPGSVHGCLPLLLSSVEHGAWPEGDQCETGGSDLS